MGAALWMTLTSRQTMRLVVRSAPVLQRVRSARQVAADVVPAGRRAQLGTGRAAAGRSAPNGPRGEGHWWERAAVGQERPWTTKCLPS